MKKLVFLIIVLLFSTGVISSQNMEGVSFVSPFKEGLAAIQKDDKWAFIDTNGEIIIDFREDLVSTQIGDLSYPMFQFNRCLISIEKEGIAYFGYINQLGETVIEPQFLNAQNFNDDQAIVIELVREQVGENNLLGKNVVYYKYYEVIIDSRGEIKSYLFDYPVPITLSREYLRRPPEITSKFLSKELIATKTESNKYIIKTIEYL